MKRSLLVLFVLLLALPLALSAQGDIQGEIELTRAVIETERQALVDGTLGLTAEEGEVFWPLYREYVQAYHRQTMVLSDTENMNFKSKTGLRFPLTDGFLASTELEANWDAETAGDADKTEIIFRLKFGYGW